MQAFRCLHLARNALRVLSAATVLAVACWPAASRAAPVTYSFSGVVTDDDGARGYQGFAGYFTLDSAATDSIGDASTASYAHSGSPWGISLAFDGGVAFGYDSQFNILVSNNLGGADQFGVLGQDGSDSIGLTLSDLTASIFTSDALPSAALTVADFDWGVLAWEAGGQRLQGQITSLLCNSGCVGQPDPGPGTGGGGEASGGNVIPLPGTLPLAAGGLLAMLPVLRRRRRTGCER